MSGVCKECGSTNIVDEIVHAQPQLVCADCGSVVSEGALVYTDNQTTSFQPAPFAKNSCRNLIKGLQRLIAICRILRVNKEIEELSKSYYKQAYEHKTFLKVSLDKKEILAGCCVLVSCKILNWPISLTSISCLLDVGPCRVQEINKDLVQSLNIETPSLGIADIMASHVQEYKITSADVPEEFAEDRKALAKRAMSLVELAGDTWIMTGRQPIPLMMASIFLAWQSMKPSQARLKFSLERFCRLANIKKPKVASKRVAELKNVLCKLGQEIPWIRQELTSESLMQQVEDILEYRFALLRRALRTHQDTQDGSQDDSRAHGDESRPDLGPDGLSSEEGSPSTQSSPHSCSKDTSQQDEEKAQQAGEGDVSELNVKRARDENWPKQLLFVPPCVLQPKRRRLNNVNDSLTEITGYEEILDSEISSYVRTPREVRDIIRAREILAQDAQ